MKAAHAKEMRLRSLVEDTGPGLPEHVMKNLYKPLVTTKGNGHSGLGLSIVYKLVQDLGGAIICSSIPSEGTKFSIRLPSGKKGPQTAGKGHEGRVEYLSG